MKSEMMKNYFEYFAKVLVKDAGIEGQNLDSLQGHKSAWIFKEYGPWMGQGPRVGHGPRVMAHRTWPSGHRL